MSWQSYYYYHRAYHLCNRTIEYQLPRIQHTLTHLRVCDINVKGELLATNDLVRLPGRAATTMMIFAYRMSTWSKK